MPRITRLATEHKRGAVEHSPFGIGRATLRYAAVALLIAGVGFNLRQIYRLVSASYGRPPIERASDNLRNMDAACALLDQAIPTAEKRTATAGVWYPFDSPVTKHHLCMIFAYRHYPLRIVSVDAHNAADIDWFIGYRAHQHSLHKHLKADYRTLTDMSRDDTFFLLARSQREPIDGHLALRAPSPPSPNAAWRLLAGAIILLAIGSAFVACNSQMKRMAMVERWLYAWVSGLLGVVVVASTVGLLGIPVFSAFPYCIAAACAMILLACRRNQTKQAASIPLESPSAPSKASWLACAILALAFLAPLLLEALSRPVSQITGMGVWGLKAMAFHEAGGLNLAMLNDPTRAYCHPTYPIGFPALTAYACGWLGQFDGWTLKLLSASMGATVAAVLYSCGRGFRMSPTSALLFSLFFCSSPTFFRQASSMQAEPLLLLFSLLGFIMLGRYLSHPKGNDGALWLGALFFSGAASVKQEGIVFLLIALSLTFVLSGAFGWTRDRRGAVTNATVVAIIVIGIVLPWQLYVRHHQLHVNDFDLRLPLEQTIAAVANNWLAGLASMLRIAFATPSTICAGFYFGAIVAAGNLGRLLRCRESSLYLLASIVLMLIFASVYVFSIHQGKRFQWHLDANERLVLLPAMLIMLMAGRLLPPQDSDQAPQHV